MSNIRSLAERIDTEKKKKLKTKAAVKDKDTSQYINVEPRIDEAVNGTAVISFGRMNPITVGHEKLVDAVGAASKKYNGTPLIYLSHTQDAKKNPLEYNDKLNIAKAAFGKVVQKSKSRTIIDVAKELQSQYKKLVVVAGSDRVKEFDTLLNKYNGKDYKYDSIEVVSAGERDPDSEGVEGMSASKMRALASDDNFKEFKKGLPKKLQGKARAVYDKVRQGMNEETQLNEITQRIVFDNLRKATAAEKAGTSLGLRVDSGAEDGKIFYVAVTGKYTTIMKWMKMIESVNENKNHRLYKDAKKQHKAGVWDGNVDKEGNPIVHINGKPVVVESNELEEALDRMQRMKRKQLMRRLKSKIAMGRKRAMKKKASVEVLKKRAHRQAIMTLKQKFAKGKDYTALDYNQRQKIDDRVAKVSDTKLNTLARKMLPKVKDAEKQRMLSKITSKTEDINASFESYIRECENTPVNVAIEIAESLGANTNYAIKEIEKISKGLSKHYLVQEALLRATDLQEEETYQEYTFESRTKSAQDKDVEDMPGSQPKNYYKGVDKDKKDDRARQFAKQAKMSDDDPDAYKPAPGDKEAKTKPSQHTKKFKDLFGERVNYERALLKKPHMLLQKNGSVKLDKRFKKFRKQPDPDMMLAQTQGATVAEQAMDIMEQAEFVLESNPKKALQNKAAKTGISYGILKKVFDRGVAAWRTGHRPGTTATQWGLARVNSFATKSKGTWGKADKDLADKVRGK